MTQPQTATPSQVPAKKVNRLNRFYRDHWKWLDPISALVFGVVAWIFTVVLPHPDWSTVYNALVGLFSALLGFAVTSLTVFLGFIDRPSLCRIYEDKTATDEIIAINKSSIRWLFVGSLLAFSMVLFPGLGTIPLTHLLLLVITSFSLVRFAGCAWLLIRLSQVLLVQGNRPPQIEVDAKPPTRIAEPDIDCE